MQRLVIATTVKPGAQKLHQLKAVIGFAGIYGSFPQMPTEEISSVDTALFGFVILAFHFLRYKQDICVLARQRFCEFGCVIVDVRQPIDHRPNLALDSLIVSRKWGNDLFEYVIVFHGGDDRHWPQWRKFARARAEAR